MAARKKYDAAVKVREYQDRDGNTKGEWLNVGAVIEYDDGGLGLMLNRTFNPAGMPDNGRGTVPVSFFEPRQNGEQPRQGIATQGNGRNAPQWTSTHGSRQAPPQSQHHTAKANGYAPTQEGFDDDIPF